MIAACAPFDPLGRYVGSTQAWVDCRTMGLGEEAFRALGPGPPFGAALPGLLTIYVALIGYRLLLGGELTVRDGMSAALKIGVVLALATQWPAWRVLVYDVATKTPEAVAASFLSVSGLNGGGSEMLAARVDGANAALGQLVNESASLLASPTGAAPARPTQTVLSEAAAVSANAAMGALVVSALAGLVGVRIVIGFLLAIGPLLIACLLFEGSRGLFMGWLRALVGTLIAAIAVPAVLALQLAIIEPQVLALQGLLKAAQPVAALPQQIYGTTLVFSLAVLAVLTAGACIGLGLVWPRGGLTSLLSAAVRETQSPMGYRRSWDEPALSRSRQIAAAAASVGLREERLGTITAPPRRLALPRPASMAPEQELQFAALPLGQTGRRRMLRQSVGARRRDELT